MPDNQDWTSRGRTVASLIEELKTLEDQTLEVRVAIDCGSTSVPISLVCNLKARYAVLFNFENPPSVIRHQRPA